MTNKSKKMIIVLIVFLAFFAIAFGGWYLYQSKECLKKINYVPEREQKNAPAVGVKKYLPGGALNKGNYYQFGFQIFKTHDEAIRACVWK